MTQAELLASAQFRLNPTVWMSAAIKDQVLARTSAGRYRLVLTPVQASILTGCFTKPSSVPEALVRLLGELECPPLNEFYELVLQSHSAGVLLTSEPLTAEPSLARRWPLRLPARATGFLGRILVGAAAAALLVPPWTAPADAADWLWGWAAACALLSAGEALAACALSGDGCEVRGLGVSWRTLFPHFSVDTQEAAMGGRARELSVAILRMTPIAVGAATVAWQRPGWLFPVLAGLFTTLAPWGGSAARQWIGARHAKPRFSVQAGILFEQRRKDTWTQMNVWRSRLSPGLAAYWVAWTAMLAAACAHFFPGVAAGFRSSGSLHPVADAALYTLAAAAVVAAVLLPRAYVAHWWVKRKMARPLRSDATRGTAGPLEGDPVAILRQVALFQDMPQEDLAALAPAMHIVPFEKNAVVFREDDPGDAFYVVLEGEMEVLKRRPKPSNRMDTIAWLGPGSGFGEIALLDPTARTATVRAAHASKLLRITKADFERLVVGRVGAARVSELLQNAAFLSRLVFMAGWPFEDLVRYARKCGTVKVEAGSAILKRGMTNHWFFLIFDGAFEARDGKRVLRRMQPGDYFGEISLLGRGEATADVVAIEESRCLTMGQSDFMKFFATDSRIGLRIEELAARRLGENLFFSR